MKKVLFVIDSLKEGGAEKILCDIVRNINKAIFDVTVLAIFDGGKYTDCIKKNSKYLSVYPQFLPKNLLNYIKNRFTLSRARYLLQRCEPSVIYKRVIKENYDLEIAFLEGYSTIFVSGSTNKSSKKVAWVHTDVIKNPWFEHYYKKTNVKKCYSKYDRILCVSEYTRHQFLKRYDNELNVSVQYNPIDEKSILLAAKEKICDIKIPNKLIIASSGRLDRQKGFDRLLEVHKMLVSDGLDCELWILGEGTERPALEKYIFDKNLTSSVKLLGYKSNPYKYINRCDLYVCSSLVEGFSTSVSEAIVLGKPVVTTECSGMREILGENEYGIITENSSQGLYEGMRKILCTKSLFEEYCARAAERGKEISQEKRMAEIECMLLNL